jgi:ATP-dependent Zn protease
VGYEAAVGPLTSAKKEKPILLGRAFAQHQDYGEDTGLRIDQEIKGISARAIHSVVERVRPRADEPRSGLADMRKETE